MAESYERRIGRPRAEQVRILRQMILPEEERKKKKQLAKAEKLKLATAEQDTEISTDNVHLPF